MTLQISTKPSQSIIIYPQEDVTADTLYLLIQPLNTLAQLISHCLMKCSHCIVCIL